LLIPFHLCGLQMKPGTGEQVPPSEATRCRFTGDPKSRATGSPAPSSTRCAAPCALVVPEQVVGPFDPLAELRGELLPS
jgi:hypothetical protein